MPVSAVLLRMERNGIRLDRAFLGELRERFEAELAGTGDAASTNWPARTSTSRAPSSWRSILFEKLGLKPIKKTATGWSTDVSVLTALADEHDLPAA